MDIRALSQKIASVLDLTALGDQETEQTTALLCQKALLPVGGVAAVCVWPWYVSLSKRLLKGSNVRVATVVNFPKGTDDLLSVQKEIMQVLQDGADEIDMVFPYHAYLDNNQDDAFSFVGACKKQCDKKTLLKVIMETGEFPNILSLKEAAKGILDAGADFLKTSTGKVPVGATPEAANALLEVIRETKTGAGLKVSGGISSCRQARDYIILASVIMGEKWVYKDHFRIGASRLLDDVLKNL
jgi:deoxyribose-phosphate aldolase